MLMKPCLPLYGAHKVRFMPPHSHVVVAEDEALVAMMVAEILEEQGHRVTVTHDGQQALDAEQADPADLLLTDLRMPRLDGNALIRRIREHRPDLPIIVMTGYSEEMPCEEVGRLVILRKPVAPDTLEAAVKSLLDPVKVA
jgi:CheY-like chemotaxis protein